MRVIHRIVVAGFALAAFAALTLEPAHGQNKETEDINVPTVDGLRLLGQWYPGSLGKQSDCVVMLHAWQGNTQKAIWAATAKELQAKGYSVLVFDQRGHGRSTTTKTIADSKLFANREQFPFNRLSGTPNQHEKIKGIDVKNFRAEYYPYLINDIAAARRYLDNRNDAGECNSGRIHLIVDRDASSMAMLWSAIEWTRGAVFLSNGAVGPSHPGGSDILSMVFLSPRPSPNVSVRNGALNAVMKDDIYSGMREKVAMAFVINTEAEKGSEFAAQFFAKWKIKPTVKEDKDLGKFLIEVKGAKNLGIDLMDEKLDTLSQIQSFMAASKKKNTNGNDWKLRNIGATEPFLIPLETYNVR